MAKQNVNTSLRIGTICVAHGLTAEHAHGNGRRVKIASPLLAFQFDDDCEAELAYRITDTENPEWEGYLRPTNLTPTRNKRLAKNFAVVVPWQSCAWQPKWISVGGAQ